MNAFLERPCMGYSHEIKKSIEVLANSILQGKSWQKSDPPFKGGWSTDLAKSDIIPMKRSWFGGLPHDWGYSSFQHLTEAELERRVGHSLQRILHHLRVGTGMHGATGKGLDQELQRLQNDEGNEDVGARPDHQKYELDWDKAKEIDPLEKAPTDKLGRRAASQRLIEIPVKKKNGHPEQFQDEKTWKSQSSTVGYHGTPLIAVPSILQRGLFASHKSRGYVSTTLVAQMYVHNAEPCATE